MTAREDHSSDSSPSVSPTPPWSTTLETGETMKAQFLDLHAAADFLGPGAVEVNRYQSEITDIVRRRGVFGQRVKQVPATGHPSRFFEQTAINSPSRGQRLRGSAQHRRHRRLAHARRAQRAAEGAGLADQLQPVRPRGRAATVAVRLPAGQRPGRLGGRPDAHPRRRAVERQRHLAVGADHAAVLRRGRADRRRRQRRHRFTPPIPASSTA